VAAAGAVEVVVAVLQPAVAVAALEPALGLFSCSLQVQSPQQVPQPLLAFESESSSHSSWSRSLQSDGSSVNS
jgi:hypothetical protein